MKLQEVTHDVTVGGAVETKEYTIKASAKAFQILSSDLYSNPIGAVVRELSTNALDAHIDAGNKEQPFDIKLPNKMDPTFRIRDYGTGLSPDKVDDVFTVLFESDKDNSNDPVGCLGLGAKTPYAISDSFTVISRQNGMKRIYSAYKNDKGIPSIALFHSEEADELDGLEIEVAVKEEDFNVYPDELNRQLKHFDVKPKVTGNSLFEWDPEQKVVLEGKETEWRVYNEFRTTAHLIQGPLSYPIRDTDMGSTFDQEKDRHILEYMLRSNIDFKVPMGSATFAPSREALSHDEATNKIILQRLREIREEIPKRIEEEISKEKCLWDAKVKMTEFMDCSSLRRILIPSEFEIDFKGEVIEDSKVDLNADDIKSVQSFRIMYTSQYSNRQSQYMKSNILYSKKIVDEEETYFYSVRAKPVSEVAIVHKTSTDKATVPRAKQYFKEHRGMKAEFIVIESDLSTGELSKQLGGPEIMPAKDLPKVKKKTPKKSSGIVCLQKFNRFGWSKKDSWNAVEMTKEEAKELTGFYVNLDRFDVYYDGMSIDFDDIVYQMKQAGVIDENERRIYGLRKSNKNLDHDLKNLFDHCREFFGKLDKPLDYTYTGRVGTIIDVTFVRDRVDDKLLNKLRDDSPVVKFLKEIETINNNKPAEKTVSTKLLSIFGFKESLTVDLDPIIREIEEHYPMIEALPTYYIGNNQKTIMDYMISLDRLREFEKQEEEK